MWSSVRIHKSIHTEITIMYCFSMISAIVILRLSVFRLIMRNRMIAPLPYKSATHAVIPVDHLEIIFEISGAISHTVTVFNQQKWFASVLFQIFLNLGKCRIHAAVQIQILIIIGHIIVSVSCTLVLGNTGWIILLRPCKCLFKIAAICTFISHRPHHDTETVLISLYHPLHPVKNSRLPFRIVCNLLIPLFEPVVVSILFAI